MRKETSNQFTKGLLSDLNPINTPNTVLTDNLNGTIITYNGNEHSLQNDMGNYELKHCKLNPNYIPVGIKEYGDILYITSYNPLNNNVEVGSYPSPLLITETKDKNYDTTINSIITPLLGMPIHEGKYTELMEKADSLIFNGEDFKLNPGDQYCLQEDISDLKKYETVDYYVLGEDSSIHNVNKIIKTDELSTDADYEHVPWTIPGWINLKVRLAELSTSGINIRHFYIPNDEDGKRTANFSLSLRLNIDDPFLLKKKDKELSVLEQWCENPNEIGFKIRILVNDVERVNTKILLYEEYNKNLTLGKFEWSDWYGDSRILWKTISGQIPNLKKTDVVKIETTPFITDKLASYSIIYDNLIKELTFDLTSIDNIPWTIGDDLYQFYLNDDKSGVVVYTDVNGPMISSFKVDLKYTISSLNKQIVTSGELLDYKGIGENVFEIPFTEDFKAENIYIINFQFVNAQNVIKEYSRILITSEIFNNFKTKLVYDRDINFDEWINYYWKLRDDLFSITYNPIGNSTIIDSKFDKTSKYWQGDKYNTFFPHENANLKPFSVYKGFNIPNKGTMIHDHKSVKGDLWNSLGIKDKLEHYDYINNSWIDFDISNFNLKAFIKADFEFNKVNMPFEFIDNLSIWNFTDSVSKLKSTPYTYKIYSNPITVGITLYGRKMDGTDSDKTWYVSGLFENNKYKHWFKCAVSNDQDLETQIKDDKILEGSKGDSIVLWLNRVFEQCKAPFLLLNVTYTLEGESANYKLFQTLVGAEHNSNFEFKESEDTKFYRSYLVFPNTAPVLIPFIADKGTIHFNRFCEAFSYIKTGDRWLKYDRYLLENTSTQEFSPRLTVKYKKSFQNKVYENIDIFDNSIKHNQFDGLNLRYDNILYSNLNAFKEFEDIVFDKTTEYNFSKEEFPYKKNDNYLGLTELQGDITKLNSNSKTEFDEWFETPYYQEHRDDIRGVYCKYIAGDDSLITAMSKYFKSSINLELHDYNKDDTPKKREVSKGVRDFLSEADRAGWIIGHDWKDSIGRDTYIDLGGCWKEDSELILADKWGWLHEV